jgi:succinyl-CoA synthetase beta subunit
LGLLRDDSAEEPSEAAARRANLSFIKLDGNVGCVGQRARPRHGHDDLVKFYGGDPANFSTSAAARVPEKVINALKIITQDPHVKAICLTFSAAFPNRRRRQRHRRGHRQFKVNVPIVIRSPAPMRRRRSRS